MGGGGASEGRSGRLSGSEEPDVGWFRSGAIDPRKFDDYLFVPTHPDNRGKARLWRSFFGLGEGDGALVERLIREQLGQATAVDQEPTVFGSDPGQSARRWELMIPRFRGPNGNVAPVRTAWALDPGADRPHLVTAYPLVG